MPGFTQLFVSKITFNWTDEDLEKFKKMKQLFLNAQVLTHTDATKEYFFLTDASEKGTSGFLKNQSQRRQNWRRFFIKDNTATQNSFYHHTEGITDNSTVPG